MDTWHQNNNKMLHGNALFTLTVEVSPLTRGTFGLFNIMLKQQQLLVGVKKA